MLSQEDKTGSSQCVSLKPGWFHDLVSLMLMQTFTKQFCRYPKALGIALNVALVLALVLALGLALGLF